MQIMRNMKMTSANLSNGLILSVKVGMQFHILKQAEIRVNCEPLNMTAITNAFRC